MSENNHILAVLFALLLFCSSVTAFAKDPTYLTDDELWSITTEVGELYDISPALLFALVETESSKNVYAENGSHKGLCQISTKWHKDRMETLGVENVFDPYGNVLTCADYLSELLGIAKKRGCEKEIEYALMRYNMATDTANEMYDRGEVSKYAKKVTKRAEELEEDARKWAAQEEIKETLTRLTQVREDGNPSDCLMPMGGIAHLYTAVLSVGDR